MRRTTPLPCADDRIQIERSRRAVVPRRACRATACAPSAGAPPRARSGRSALPAPSAEITPGRSSVGASTSDSTVDSMPDARRTAVQRVVGQRFGNVRGRGRREFREAVGAGRGDRHARGANQLERHRVRRHAQADGRQSGGDDVGNFRAAWGPPASAGRASSGAPAVRRLRASATPASRAISTESTCTISGLVRGRPLASKMRATASAIERVGAQAVHRLGGKRHQPAGADQLGGALDAPALTPATRLYRRRRSCRSCARPDRRGSAGRDRLRARGPRSPIASRLRRSFTRRYGAST